MGKFERLLREIAQWLCVVAKNGIAIVAGLF
jgi:hypothetical protein